MTDLHPTLVKIASMARLSQQRGGAGGLPRVLEVPAGHGDATVALPRIRLQGSPLSGLRARQALAPIFGPVALAVLVAMTLCVVLVASAAPSNLVQGSYGTFPTWMAGPLHGLLSPLLQNAAGKATLPWQTVDYGYTGVLVLMMIAYAVAVASARTLSMRAIAATLAVLYLLLALSPPLGLSDVFNYLGYARLEGLHGMNPYHHVIADEFYDPVYAFGTWRHYHSPYGQVFSLLTYPLGLMSLSASYWVLKIGMVLLVGAFVALVWKCAVQLGHDPRPAVVLVALNPLVLLDDVGGFHNDPVMLVPMMAAVSLLIARRYRWAGAALAVAIGVKPTIVLLLPFLMLAARPARKSLQVLLGTVLGGIAVGAASFAAYGLATPNVADQSIIVTPYSIVNLVGVALHVGGATPGMEQASKFALVLVVVTLVGLCLWRERPDWLSGAGWATLGLLACTSWLMPWYIVWALPFVALSTSRTLRRATVLFMTFVLITFLPLFAIEVGRLHINPMNSKADQVAIWKLYEFQH